MFLLLTRRFEMIFLYDYMDYGKCHGDFNTCSMSIRVLDATICVCVCVCLCVRACVCACMRSCVL